VRIKKLTLKNFMAYRGTHTIDFSVPDSAPLILFLGENGHGKSTIQHACKWCLYGETVDRRRPVPAINLVNRKSRASENKPEMSVELEWEDAGKLYSLKRSLAATNDETVDARVSLRINGENPLPVADVQNIVQRTIAKEISHFFFFDGETQDEFDKMNTGTSHAASFIRQQVEASLAIPAIKDAELAFEIERDQESRGLEKANKQQEKIAQEAKRADELRMQRKIKLETIENERKRLDDSDQTIEEYEEKLRSIGATVKLTAERDEIRGFLKSASSQMEELKGYLRTLLGNFPWIPLAAKLQDLSNSLRQKLIDLERQEATNQRLQMQIDNWERLLGDDSCPVCGTARNGDPSSIHALIANAKSEQSAIATSAIDQTREHLGRLLKLSFSDTPHLEFRNLKKQLDAAGRDVAIRKQRLRDIDSALALHGDVDVKLISDVLRTAERNRAQSQSAIATYDGEVKALNAEIDRIQSLISKDVPARERLPYSAYAYMAHLLKLVREDYTDAVRRDVEKHASKTFLSIISDPKYLGLSINQNYGVDLVLADGTSDALRSTGQGKVATISLISGLIRIAMEKGFIMMDTPFVSLDIGHRKAVCKWSTTSGLQVSLFMHSGEFVWERDHQQFGEAVGRVYVIQKVDDDESVVKAKVIA
jgi:DNA sulfur modification protein DndD